MTSYPSCAASLRLEARAAPERRQERRSALVHEGRNRSTYGLSSFAQCCDEAHEDESGTDPDDEPGEEVVE
jgi:hypothetical protein